MDRIFCHIYNSCYKWLHCNKAETKTGLDFHNCLMGESVVKCGMGYGFMEKLSSLIRHVKRVKFYTNCKKSIWYTALACTLHHVTSGAISTCFTQHNIWQDRSSEPGPGTKWKIQGFSKVCSPGQVDCSAGLTAPVCCEQFSLSKNFEHTAVSWRTRQGCVSAHRSEWYPIGCVSAEKTMCSFRVGWMVQR